MNATLDRIIPDFATATCHGVANSTSVDKHTHALNIEWSECSAHLCFFPPTQFPTEVWWDSDFNPDDGSRSTP